MPSATTSRTERVLRGTLLAAVLGALAACTNVKLSIQNPQTGEVWTVNEHTFGSDTVSYCPPPQSGAPCRRARMLDGPPAVSPAAGQSPWQSPYPGMPGQPPYGNPPYTNPPYTNPPYGNPPPGWYPPPGTQMPYPGYPMPGAQPQQ